MHLPRHLVSSFVIGLGIAAIGAGCTAGVGGTGIPEVVGQQAVEGGTDSDVTPTADGGGLATDGGKAGDGGSQTPGEPKRHVSVTIDGVEAKVTDAWAERDPTFAAGTNEPKINILLDPSSVAGANGYSAGLVMLIASSATSCESSGVHTSVARASFLYHSTIRNPGEACTLSVLRTPKKGGWTSGTMTSVARTYGGELSLKFSVTWELEMTTP